MVEKVPKKESAKRGYMTAEEVEKHLKSYEHGYQIREYLTKILKHEKRLSPKTRETVYEKIIDEELRAGNNDRAQSIAEKMGKGGEKYFPKIFEGYLTEMNPSENINVLEGNWKNFGRAGKLATLLGPEAQQNLLERYIMASHSTRLWMEPARNLAKRIGKEEETSLELARAEGAIRHREHRAGLKSYRWIVIAIAGVLGGIFFLSSNITGNAISNVSQSSGNILGAVLLVVGLVAGFFWVKKK